VTRQQIGVRRSCWSYLDQSKSTVYLEHDSLSEAVVPLNRQLLWLIGVWEN